MRVLFISTFLCMWLDYRYVQNCQVSNHLPCYKQTFYRDILRNILLQVHFCDIPNWIPLFRLTGSR